MESTRMNALELGRTSHRFVNRMVWFLVAIYAIALAVYSIWCMEPPPR